METFEFRSYSAQTLCDVTTIIKNFGTGSPDSRSRIEAVVSAILSDLSRLGSSDELGLTSSLRCLHLLLQVCVDCDVCVNECSTDLAVKTLKISTSLLQKIVKTFDATANTLCNIVHLCFLLMTSEDLNKNATAVISKCEEALSVYLTSDIRQVNNFDPQIAVQLLSALLSSAYKKDIPYITQSEHCFELNNVRITHELVIQLCLCKNDSLRSQTLLILVPKILKQEDKNILLEKLLDEIVKCESEESLNRALAASSALCTYYFPDIDSNIVLSVEENNAFWLLVERGLCSDSPLSRKHALFLIRRCLSSLVNRQKEVNCDMFFWVSDQREKLFSWWQDICTILEVLEERAFHLVSPVLGTLQNIFSGVSHDLSPTCFLKWCLTVFRRLLQHSCIQVVKWGVGILISDLGCNLISSKHTRIFHQFFLNTMIHSLNSPHIYYEMEDESEHDEELSEFEYLGKYFESAAKSEIRQELFITLFDRMGSLNWAPIPLYIFTKSLMKVPSFKCLNPEDTPIIKRLVNKILATQNVSIRSVCLQHLLVTVINLTNSNNLDLKAVQDILSAFNFGGNVTRNSELWNHIVAWISETFKENEVVSWVTESTVSSEYSPPVFAQLVTLLFDACLVKKLNSLENLFSLLSDCDTRLYVDQEAQTKCVEFIANILRASRGLGEYDMQSYDKTRETVLYFVKTIAPDVSLLFKKRLLCVDNLAAYDIATRLLKCFELFCQDEVVVQIFSEEKSFVSLVFMAFDIIENNLSEKSVNFLFAMTIVKSWCENQDLISNTQLLESRDRLLMEILLSNTLTEAPFARSSKLPHWTAELLGPISSSVFEALWGFVASSISESISEATAEGMMEAIAVGLDAGGRNLLPILLKVLKKLVAKYPASDTPAAVFRNCWSNILEVRHKDIFYPALREFLGAVFQPAIVRTEWGKIFVLECGQELFSWGESAICVISELAYALQSLVHEFPDVILLEPIRNLVVSCFVLSTIQRQDQKLLRRITSSITCKENLNSIFQPSRDDPVAFVRCTAIEIFLWSISREEVPTTEIADLLTEDLLKQTEMPEAKRARYFSNSLTHRIHLHVLQGLMLIESRTSNETKEALGEWLLRRLLNENHQLSVRYLTEWLLVRTFSIKKFRSDLLDLVQAGDIRESALCSIICTLLQLSQSLQVEPEKVEDAGKFLSQFFEALLPLTMSQAYSVRFNAHVAILRVWETMKKLQLEREIDLYKISASAVQKSFTRASNKFQNHKDFYLTEFKCVEHFSLETLFYDIPRLTHMSPDECLEPELLRRTGIGETSPVLLVNKDRRLREFIPAINRRSEVSNVVAESGFIQKKMVPSKWLEINELQVKSLPEVLRPWRREAEDFPCRGLIVVASLLDKASNLGGLSRTCEIMGASLVLPKMSFATDREFQALSMSSEMWAPLSEVKPHKLPEFLNEMKKRGFRLVGAEQTAKSTPLNSIQFDENTVLLLGNESEGIPSNLLPILDVCVEIPQFGLVRSLNVHVAGALFIYEYRRQHSAARDVMPC